MVKCKIFYHLQFSNIFLHHPLNHPSPRILGARWLMWDQKTALKDFLYHHGLNSVIKESARRMRLFGFKVAEMHNKNVNLLLHSRKWFILSVDTIGGLWYNGKRTTFRGFELSQIVEWKKYPITILRGGGLFWKNMSNLNWK